jgi:type II secretory pathway pseudopilin PulG
VTRPPATNADRAGSAEAGLTRVELLVVGVVLATLGAVVVISVAGLSGGNATQACKDEYRYVETAVAGYQTRNGTSVAPTVADSDLAGTPYAEGYIRTPTVGRYTISAAGKVTLVRYPDVTSGCP